MRPTVITVALCAVVALGSSSCDKLSEQLNMVEGAKQNASFSLYYAKLGMQMGQVEEQWGTVFPAISDAAQKPALRESALKGAEGLVDQLDSVVKANAPDEANAHRGHQAAVNMVTRRRAAIAKLRQDWKGVTDPFKSTEPVVAFSNEWMAARTDFMNTVGQESQNVLGASADKAAQGAARASPEAKAALEAAKAAGRKSTL